MNTKLSVFGGTGFIGSVFCKKYPDSIIIDRDETNSITNNILYLISTVDNYNVLTNPHIDIETNLVHLMKVLENCKNTDTIFTFISSWFVYGKTELPANENSICSPKGFYSITKYTAEQLVESYCKTFDIKYKIIRLGNVVGKNDNKVSKKKNALQFLLNKIKENNKINLYNEGQFYRDYIDVEDVADGIKFIIDNGGDNEIYNLASGSPVLFKDIIDYAYTQLNSTSEVGVMEPTDFHKLVQVESMYLDTTKLNNLGFKPSKNIYQIIDNLIK